MRLVFWQNIVSIQQQAQVRALSRREGVDVTLVAAGELPAWRRDMGWSTPDYGSARLVVAPTWAVARGVMDEVGPDALHLFSGLHGVPLLERAARHALSTGRRVGLHSEAHHWLGLRGALRLARGRREASQLAERLELVLAIGSLGMRWYRMCGYPDRLLYPYAYFMDAVAAEAPAPRGEQPLLVFVGQCIERKGIDILLRALAPLAGKPWTLEILGDGRQRRELEEMTSDLGLSSRVNFRGSLANEVAMQRVAAADLLVLPSRWDGWGVVVNEALVRGTPAVCSDRCGAEIILAPDRGSVFRSGSESGLRDAILPWLRRLPAVERERIRSWAACISGEAAADYLLSIARGGPKPVPPWRRVEEVAA